MFCVHNIIDNAPVSSSIFISLPFIQCERMHFIKWMLHLNSYTRGGLRLCRVITNNSCMTPRVTLDLYAQASGQVDKNRTQGQMLSPLLSVYPVV